MVSLPAMTIHSLPVELIARIFVLGAADQYSDSPFLLRPDEDYCSTASADFQLISSQVCQHWRQIAIRTSSLWTSLHFREPVHITRAEAFLSRASPNYPLDILVDTVSPEEHIPGVTLCREEMRTIFELITPHVARWRAFHLKELVPHEVWNRFSHCLQVRADECKLIARQALSTCGPAPRLETLQLYHFEDYRTAHNLYIATYRDPVMIFNNVLPSLKNVSLIGVNLPWAHSPYLKQLDALELALHPDNIRPPFDVWDAMLRESPRLRRLLLHYSGPRVASKSPDSRISVPTLEELSLTDLDPEHLTTMLKTLDLPHLTTLSMDLPDQDYTSAMQLLTEESECPPIQLAGLHTLRIAALECQAEILAKLIRAASALRVLELDFSAISPRHVLLDILFEATVVSDEDEDEDSGCSCKRQRRRIPIFPHLKEVRLFGLDGTKLRDLIAFRSGFKCSCANHVPLPRFVVRWSPGPGKERDKVLDELVENCKVEYMEEKYDELEEDDDGSNSDGSMDAGSGTNDSVDSND
ncbi:F-box domain-containing protein [Mycena indigotica]|uniref:F-box domain-containing protein n=1 Tax=Mycena indigotica TaxID=2126181 RepID=A0A8H6W231_9AGAR|nr:F-box domain-containing protein [Mycena indigotica]KAF7298833.1 F-box domain-containing protein [Mycena indigotica]